jgi:hypothetical protein
MAMKAVAGENLANFSRTYMGEVGIKQIQLHLIKREERQWLTS